MDTILFITCRSCTCRSWLWKICFVEVIEKLLCFVKTLIFFKAKVKLAVQQHPAEPVHFVRCCVTHQVVVRQCIYGYFLKTLWNDCPFFFQSCFVLFPIQNQFLRHQSCLVLFPIRNQSLLVFYVCQQCLADSIKWLPMLSTFFFLKLNHKCFNFRVVINDSLLHNMIQSCIALKIKIKMKN